MEDDDDQPLTPDAQISQLPRGALVRLVRDAYASGGISAEALAAAAANPRKFARLPSERSAARALDPDYEYRRAHSLSAEEALAAGIGGIFCRNRGVLATGGSGIGLSSTCGVGCVDIGREGGVGRFWINCPRRGDGGYMLVSEIGSGGCVGGVCCEVERSGAVGRGGMN